MLIAKVEPSVCGSGAFADNFAQDRAVCASLEGNDLILRTRDPLEVKLTLDDVKRSIAVIQKWPDSEAGRLTWQFSGVSLDCGDLSRLVSRWDETHEPPVLDIISVRLDTAEEEDGTHRTHGLQAFVGHEIAAHYRAHEQCENAARALARLARQILMQGAIPDTVFQVALDGKYHGLIHRKEPDARNVMVTIML